MGTPKTAPLLDEIVGPLAEVARQRTVRIVTVGAPGRFLADAPIETHEWSEATEASEIASFDVGLMPLLDVPFQRGKCGYKLIQYMACGLPVVASPVGVNTEIVEHRSNGFLASSPEDWVDSLITLIDDHQLARTMGMRGRAKIERQYNLLHAAPQLAAWLWETGRVA
jgi:glycosyltransferase involved in cell wall biosynthesis